MELDLLGVRRFALKDTADIRRRQYLLRSDMIAAHALNLKYGFAECEKILIAVRIGRLLAA